MYKQFRKLDNDEILVIGADPSEGGDPCAAIAVSRKYIDVPVVFSVQMESSQFGYELDKLGRYIKQQTDQYPMIAVEKNVGAATIARLIDLNYPSLFKMRDFTKGDDKESTSFGWVTSVSTRPKMLDDLAMAVRQQAIKIYDEPTINELYSFIRNDRGKPEARSGCHDDLVMALAIAWQLYLLGTSGHKDIFPEPPANSFQKTLERIQSKNKKYIGDW